MLRGVRAPEGGWVKEASEKPRRTFIFPTASSSRLGQDKWQLGPAGVFGYLGEKFLVGIFPQQWWSNGGPGKNTISVEDDIPIVLAHRRCSGWDFCQCAVRCLGRMPRQR